MGLILCIETATTVCSVALAKEGSLISLREIDAGYSHAENLTVFIREVCAEAGIDLQSIDAIAVSEGPGSYTGLRIGTSTAKGLCYALDKPLIAVSTLQSMAWLGSAYLIASQRKMDLLCPMIDARRMEVYCALYDSEIKKILGPEAKLISHESFSKELESHDILFFGDGSEKCKPLFKNLPHAHFATVPLSAKGMISLAEKNFQEKTFSDVSLFEPFYLKEAHIGKT